MGFEENLLGDNLKNKKEYKKLLKKRKLENGTVADTQSNGDHSINGLDDEGEEEPEEKKLKTDNDSKAEDDSAEKRSEQKEKKRKRDQKRRRRERKLKEA